MKKEDDEMIEQIIKSLKEAGDILDESYKRNDFQKFNQAKKLILQIQKEVSEMASR